MSTQIEATPRPERKPKLPAKQRWALRGPLLPALTVLIVLTQLPFVVTVVISTFNWNIMYPDERHFAGLQNFRTVLSDNRMRDALVHTILLTAGVVILALICGLALAVLLDRKFHGRALLRTMLITPFLITPVAAMLVWKHLIFNPTYGLLNGITTQVLGLFGKDTIVQTDWISDKPLIAVAVPMIWQWTPFMMLILLAGLQSQSPDILEAANMDGAGPWRIFRFISLSHLRPYMELSVVLGTIYISQSMDAVFTITQGGPGSASTTMPYEIYLTMFRKYDYGEAAAAGVVIVVITIIIATFALRTLSSLVEESRS